MACIGFREPVLACAGCHGSFLAFVGSSLAGKYMKILISWKKDEKRTKKKKIWVPNDICRRLVPIWLSWVLVGFHRPALAATGPRWPALVAMGCVGLHGLSWAFAGPRWPTLAFVGLFWLPWVLTGLCWLSWVLVVCVGLHWLATPCVGLCWPALAWEQNPSVVVCHRGVKMNL